MCGGRRVQRVLQRRRLLVSVRRDVQRHVHGGGLLVHGRGVPLRARATLGAIAVAMALAHAAHADDDRARARAAYDEGTREYARGELAKAAASYARADAIAPSPVALQAALDACVKADDAVLGAELLERARSRDASGALEASVRAAEAKLAHRAGRVKAACPAACTATMDGVALDIGRARWVAVGTHAITFSIDGRSEARAIDVTADAEVAIEPSPPPQTPPTIYTRTDVTPPPPLVTIAPSEQPIALRARAKGLPPAVFWASLGATVALGTASAILLAVTQSTHDSFVSQSCATQTTASCNSLASSGTATMATGDALLGVSIAAAVWTIVAGALTRWHATVEVAPSTHGAAIFWRMSF